MPKAQYRERIWQHLRQFGNADMVAAMTNWTATDLRKEWGDTLRLERLRRRLSQEDVARQLGIHSSAVSRVENGRGSLDLFLSVAQTLDTDLVGER